MTLGSRVGLGGIDDSHRLDQQVGISPTFVTTG
jgi:hypothetical protein